MLSCTGPVRSPHILSQIGPLLSAPQVLRVGEPGESNPLAGRLAGKEASLAKAQI